MNLLPEQLDELQPVEFYELWEGYQWRKRQKENHDAYFTAAILSALTGKPQNPGDLLKPLREKKKLDKKQEVEYLQKRFKLK